MTPSIILPSTDGTEPRDDHKTHQIDEVAALQSYLEKLNTIDASKLYESADLRTEVVSLTQKLALAIEDPDRVAMRYAYEMSSQRMAVRFAVDLNIFDKLWSSRQTSLDSSTLARACGCEELLLVRMMRSLVAHGLVSETAPKRYKATRLTEGFTKAPIAATLKICHNYSGAIQGRVHEYFSKSGYQSPTSASDGPFQWYFRTEKSYFEYLHSEPGMSKVFSTMMSGIGLNRRHWSSWFPVKEVILQDAYRDSSPLIVDMGGATGHDLVKLQENYPETRNRLILQDLPGVVEGLSLDGIKCTAHDFFQPQPELGARVYYLHLVLHDWPDSKSRLILQNIGRAMTRGYSKLLLNEHVVPDQGATARVAAMDLNMMCNFGGLERSESHWKQLLESAGLELVKVWKLQNANDTEGIVEARIPEHYD